VDGSKCGLNQDRYKLGRVNVWSSEKWSRLELHKKIVDGLVAIYHRSKFDSDWSEFANAQILMQDYLWKRAEGYSSLDALYDVEVGV
jgi:hypothetical protein